MEVGNVEQSNRQPGDLSEVRGLDLNVGLASTRHNEVLYLRLLMKFVAREHNFASECAALIRAGEREAAIRRAHDLRATGGALGALAIAIQAQALENALRRGGDVEELQMFLRTVEVLLSPLLSELAYLQ